LALEPLEDRTLLAVATVGAPDPSADEVGNDPGTFAIGLTDADPDSEYTVGFVFGGSAGADDYIVNASCDFTPGEPGQTWYVHFSPGETAKTLSITPINDARNDPQQTVELNLTSIEGGCCGGSENSIGTPSSATVTIADDDDDWTISVGTSSADLVEAEPGTGSFTINRSGGTDTRYAITVDFTMSGVAEQGTDYVLKKADGTPISGGSIDIPAGQTSVTVTVDPTNDSEKEPDEGVGMTLQSAHSDGIWDPMGGGCCGAWGAGGPFPIDPANNSATITILDDDDWMVGITAPDDEAREPGDPLPFNPGLYRLTRSPARSVPYAMDTSYGIDVRLDVGGTAIQETYGVEDPDYVLEVDSQQVTCWVTIPMWQTTRDVDLIVRGDALPEPLETAILTVILPDACCGGGGPDPYTIDPAHSSATVTIEDNDGWKVSLDRGAPSGCEPNAIERLPNVVQDHGYIEVTRYDEPSDGAPAGDTSYPISVEFELFGEAVRGEDYQVSAVAAVGEHGEIEPWGGIYLVGSRPQPPYVDRMIDTWSITIPEDLTTAWVRITPIFDWLDEGLPGGHDQIPIPADERDYGEGIDALLTDASWGGMGENWDAVGSPTSAYVVIHDGAIVRIRTDSNNDGTLDDTDLDPALDQAPAPGRVLAVNDNDSDRDDTVDLTQSPVPGEQDLAAVELFAWIDELGTNQFDVVVQTTSSGVSAFALWDIMDKVVPYSWQPGTTETAPFPNPTTPTLSGTANTFNTMVYLEGLSQTQDNLSLVARDVACVHPTGTDTARFTVVHPDVDIDSDNNNGKYGGPDRSAAEDALENKSTEIGKLVPPNHGDVDEDDILDCWDGYSLGSHQEATPDNGFGIASELFVPIKVSIPEFLDVTSIQLSFDYSMASTTPPGDLTVPPDTGQGRIRIWTKNGTEARDGSAIGAGGDVVWEGVKNDATLLGFDASLRTVPLYVEGVTLSQFPGSTIKMSVYCGVRPDGSPVFVDEVRYAVGEFVVSGNLTYGVGFTLPVRGAHVVLQDFSFTDPQTGLDYYEDVAGGYTNDQGQFVVGLPDSKTLDNVDRVRVYARTKPCGVGPEFVYRSCNVSPELSGSTYDVKFFDVSDPAHAAIRDAAFWHLAIPDYNIGNATTAQKAFWVYDATVTGCRFHATLPDVQPGHVSAEFPWDLADASYGYFGATHIDGDAYDDYDTIVHEYGHLVAQEAGFFVLHLDHLYHEVDENVRITQGCACRACAQLGFSEGWANFYSVVAQVEEGVPNKTQIGSGDDAFWSYDVETHDNNHKGEDQEIAVMRLLWDLYDGPGEAYDRKELGVDAVYELCRDHSINTVSALWNVLAGAVETGPTYFAEMDDLADVFVEAGVGCDGLNASFGTQSGLAVSWTSTDPAPTFEWTVPLSGDLQLFDRFRIQFFDADGTLIGVTDTISFPTGTFGTGANTATYTIPVDEWEQIIDGRSEVYWTVTCGEQWDFHYCILGGYPIFPWMSGWYWSNDVGQITIY
jgi:hypothetical protein